MNKFVWLLFLVFLSFGSVAQERGDEHTKVDKNKLLQEMCKSGKCQHNIHVVLKQSDSKTFDRTFNVLPPVVQDFGIVVLAGQTIHVEAEISGDHLTGFKVVDTVVHTDRTITAKLEQNQDGSMMLTLNNPFEKTIKFSMGVMPLDTNRLFKTSSCPVSAGKGSIEMWPYPIFQVVLGNAHLLKDGDDMGCVE